MGNDDEDDKINLLIFGQMSQSSFFFFFLSWAGLYEIKMGFNFLKVRRLGANIKLYFHGKSHTINWSKSGMKAEKEKSWSTIDLERLIWVFEWHSIQGTHIEKLHFCSSLFIRVCRFHARRRMYIISRENDQMLTSTWKSPYWKFPYDALVD